MMEACYRRDYIGEVIDDSRSHNRLFVKPRDIFTRDKGTAMVIGNGMSRTNDTFDLMMRTNRKRPMPNYKITYACNGAVWDVDADWYVINNRMIMTHLREKELYPQIFLPWHLFLDYNKCNMLPLVHDLDAGSTAAFLAAFDGHNKICLFGFDGQDAEYSNIYAGKTGYSEQHSAADPNSWAENLRSVMRAFRDVEFIRVGSGRTPSIWRDLGNFREASYAEATRLADF